MTLRLATVDLAALDLAARWLGGSVLAASDESFGLKENLLVESPAAFTPGHYDHRGEIVDGWETRRRRSTHDGEAEHDWVIVRLGAPGRISVIDVDTSFFTGNFPTSCRVEALAAEGYPTVAALTAPTTPWLELAPDTKLVGDAHNLIEVSDPHRFTHVRLLAYPDGGIARLRVYGEVIPDPTRWEDITVELSGAEHGARVLLSSDDFYTSADRLIRPDRPATMGEGWETARRRDGGNDTVLIALAARGRLRRLEVDTTHFKYNASAQVQLWGAHCVPTDLPADADITDFVGTIAWQPLMPRTVLQPDTRHLFDLAGEDIGILRLDAFPDGGLARVRVLGTPTAAARELAYQRWREASPNTAERIR